MVETRYDNCGILTKMGDNSTHDGTRKPPVDGVDFPHTGLIKLFDAQRYGYVILSKDVTTGSSSSTAGSVFDCNFNIGMDDTTSSGNTTISVMSGAVIRDGILVNVSTGASVGVGVKITEITSGTPAGNATDGFTEFIEQGTSGQNFYHVIVVNHANAIKIRNPSAQDTVAELGAGDIPIAILRVQNGETPTTRHIQYLGTDRRSGGLSVYYKDGTSPTEALQISASAGDTTIENKVSDKDIIFQVNDGGSASTEVMRVDGSSSRVGIGATAPTAKLEVKGDTAISRSADSGQTRTLSIEGARNATGTDYARIDLENYDSHGPTSYVGARISAVNEADGVNDGTLVFSTNNANAGITERVRIDDEGNVGIGTNSPDTKLHIAGDDLKIVSATNAKPLLTLENTTATSSAATPPTILFKRSGTPAQSGDLGMLQFIGKDSDDDSEHEYVRIFADMQDETETTEDGRLIFNIGRGSNQANSVSNTEMLRLSGGEGVIFNHPKNNVDFEIRGDTNDNLFFADAGNERVGILNGSPDATLDMVTGGTFRNTRLLTVSVSASTTLTEAAHAGRYNICAGNVVLPSTSTAGEHYAILNTTGGNITIGRNGNNINGAGSDFTLATFKAATCIAIGSNNWMVVG